MILKMYQEEEYIKEKGHNKLWSKAVYVAVFDHQLLVDRNIDKYEVAAFYPGFKALAIFPNF